MDYIDRKVFYAYARKSPFGGRLTQDQVSGTDSIIDAYEAFLAKNPHRGNYNIKHLAYILATAFHETGGKMIPVREGFAKSDSSARKIVAKYKYSKPDPETGHVYYGRGHVQLTWAENYKKMGKLLGIPLYKNPDLALDFVTSGKILVEGMLRGESNKGDFTGKALEDYFNETVEDPIGARRIINGTDKAKLIASYYQAFFDALDHARLSLDKMANRVDVAIEPEQSEPDKPNLMKDQTVIGTVSAVAGSGALGIFSSIDSPWAFAAFALLAVGAFLFFTGRIKIVNKGGV